MRFFQIRYSSNIPVDRYSGEGAKTFRSGLDPAIALAAMFRFFLNHPEWKTLDQLETGQQVVKTKEGIV